MRIAVTGGTGLIGRRLVRALAERGDEVAVFTRDRRDGRDPTGGRVRLVHWDYERDEDQNGELANAEAVVHLAGAPIADARWTPERIALLRSSRIDVTARLARAIARVVDGGGRAGGRAGGAGGPRVLVSGSAVGIYGMAAGDAILDEQSPLGSDLLAEIGKGWEASTDAAQRAGVRVAHSRTGIVLAPEGGALGKMVGAFKRFVGGPIGSGDQWFPWIHARDAVAGLIFALDTPALAGPFNLCAPHPVTMAHFARALGNALGRPSIVRVPAFALKLGLGAGLAEVLLTGQRALPRALSAGGFAFEFTEVESALRDLVAQ